MDPIAAGVLRGWRCVIGKSDPFPRLELPPDFGVGLWKPIAYDGYEKFLMGVGRDVKELMLAVLRFTTS